MKRREFTRASRAVFFFVGALSLGCPINCARATYYMHVTPSEYREYLAGFLPRSTVIIAGHVISSRPYPCGPQGSQTNCHQLQVSADDVLAGAMSPGESVTFVSTGTERNACPGRLVRAW